jgi:hypothetical protein
MKDMNLEGTLLVSEYKANNNNNNDSDNGRHGRHHYFAICRACFWTATLLRTRQIANNNKINNLDSKITSCPVCFDHQVSLIPLIMY